MVLPAAWILIFKLGFIRDSSECSLAFRPGTSDVLPTRTMLLASCGFRSMSSRSSTVCTSLIRPIPPWTSATSSSILSSSGFFARLIGTYSLLEVSLAWPSLLMMFPSSGVSKPVIGVDSVSSGENNELLSAARSFFVNGTASPSGSSNQRTWSSDSFGSSPSSSMQLNKVSFISCNTLSLANSWNDLDTSKSYLRSWNSALDAGDS
ncbi:hypothetical protein OGAPHI_002029 [Ogataea philodendri]|uniref:Uncharacterized protein n=1 Tax=Ogataea philodendri TaxID=1378263 RepID=A0A9P8PB12_9ASCO|nr:uncharacterized protein OGAPHI_002029 [Ogataea philodendri]KAH3668275.1 hypothetical protein OGAPHI_002029 [Ogataea philodendri]